MAESLIPPTTLTLRRPDDFHLHLRDGALLGRVLPHTAATFGRALVMPNTEPPVLTGADAERYRKEIVSALPGSGSGSGSAFEPLMTIKIVPSTTPAPAGLVRDAGCDVCAVVRAVEADLGDRLVRAVARGAEV